LLLFGGRACAGHQTELDLYLVGDGAEVGPHAVADRVIGALEDQAAFEGSAVAFLAQGDRRGQIQGLALDSSFCRRLQNGCCRGA
jgi:hypothetical protein